MDVLFCQRPDWLRSWFLYSSSSIVHESEIPSLRRPYSNIARSIKCIDGYCISRFPKNGRRYRKRQNDHTLTQGLSVIPLLLIPTSQNFVIAAFFYTIRSALMNMSSPVFTSYMMGAVSKEEMASVAGITATAWNGSTAISTIISGYIMNVVVDIPVYLCGVFYILSTT